MYIWKFIQSKLSKRPLVFLLLALLLSSAFISTMAPHMALAEIYNEPGGGGHTGGGGSGGSGYYDPPANGFDWSVPARYGMDRNSDLMIDTYWRVASKDYDPAYIYPSYWPMEFNGCQEWEDMEGTGDNTYTWNISGTVITDAGCAFTYVGFTHQGTYPVTMTVTAPDGTSASYPQEVYIKDYLIAAIGDSLASGEGNPDVDQRFNDLGLPEYPARWQDSRCHRTADAYPSRAALAIEIADPHTSVTFISFACSGATIMTPAWAPVGPIFFWPFLDLDPDSSKYRGTGLLGPYAGADWSDYNISTFIPSQIQQLQNALINPGGGERRRFDALVMSAGGNDLHFGDIAITCLFDDSCWPDAMVWENANTQYNMEYLVSRALNPVASGGSPTNVPESLAALATAVGQLDPRPADVYITQYADQTREDVPGDPSPRYCSLLFDIWAPLTTWGVTPQEAAPLSQTALHGLNHAILDVVNANATSSWHYVDGISSYEVEPGKTPGSPAGFVRDENGIGHGYCAADNWIIRADESVDIQGPWPFRLLTQGTLHPNSKGIELIKNRLLYYMLPNLEDDTPGAPVGDPPVFTSSFTSNGLTSQAGENGWYTHSCDSSQNCSDYQAVLQVTATGTAALEAANVYVNGQEGCTQPGVSCTTTYITDTHQLIWDFAFVLDGIYQMNFSASDVNDQVSTYLSEIKVDLNDPYFDPTPGPYSVDEGSSISLTTVPIDAMSEVINLDWDLDNDGIFETTDEQPVFSAASLDGPESMDISVRATDEAGRSVIQSATLSALNVVPTPEINGAPATEQEGIAISLTSDVTDPGVLDTFTYAWEVKMGTTTYATGTGADLSFTPADEGMYEVYLTVTDDDGGVGTANLQTIEVTNVAPVLSNLSVPSTGVDEADSFTLSGDITEPGTFDTLELTIDWGDGSTPELLSLPAGSTEFTADHTYADDDPTATASDTYDISLYIEDNDGSSGAETASLVVNNLPPTLAITAPENGALSAVNTTVDLSASLADASALDTLACSVDWGDGASGSATLTDGLCTASHVYTAAGVYTVQVTGSDDDLGESTASVMAVVYDPTAGFVTGGGWINSLAGAYKPDPTLSGKATFGFVSKYHKGADVPTGNTAFEFDLAGLEFSSLSYEWLVVNQNDTNAQFKGSGLLNAALDPNGNAYKFMVWAGDSSPDTFRIRIWWEDAAGAYDVYDNGFNLAIGGGSIVVHADR